MSPKLSIYMAHPITGLQGKEVINYYSETKDFLSDIGYEVYCPMIAKGYMISEKEFKSHGYDGNPIALNHAIKERDKWMVKSSKVLLLDLSGSKNVSIGCVMELAWAEEFGNHTIVVMEKDNIHNHAFVLESADIVFDNIDDARVYLGKLIKGEM